MEKPDKCAKCGSKDIIHISYGLLTPEGREKVQRGEIAMGGCIIRKDSPRWYCKQCHNRFGKIRLSRQF